VKAQNLPAAARHFAFNQSSPVRPPLRGARIGFYHIKTSIVSSKIDSNQNPATQRWIKFEVRLCAGRATKEAEGEKFHKTGGRVTWRKDGETVQPFLLKIVLLHWRPGWDFSSRQRRENRPVAFADRYPGRDVLCSWYMNKKLYCYVEYRTYTEFLYTQPGFPHVPGASYRGRMASLLPFGCVVSEKMVDNAKP